MVKQGLFVPQRRARPLEIERRALAALACLFVLVHAFFVGLAAAQFAVAGEAPFEICHASAQADGAAAPDAPAGSVPSAPCSLCVHAFGGLALAPELAIAAVSARLIPVRHFALTPIEAAPAPAGPGQPRGPPVLA